MEKVKNSKDKEILALSNKKQALSQNMPSSAVYDIILITGDAYVDHPYFGAAVIKKFMESFGFSVAVIDQPDWKTNKDFLKYGTPKLFFGVTAGNLDSMLANYSPLKKPRDQDHYSKDNKPGKRPDRATLVYCNKLRELFKGKLNINNEQVPIVIGGIEASLRRFAHYDYWDNNIRKSILAESRADLLVYGMGEHAVLDIANAIKSGKKVAELTNIQNVCYKSKVLPNNDDGNNNNDNKSNPSKYILLPSFDEIKGNDIKSKKLFNLAFKLSYEKEFIAQKQNSNSDQLIIQNPMRVLTEKELDYIYELPYTRQSDIPAIKSVQWSVLSHRGCFGKCSFCSIFLHQGKIIQSRSFESIKKEIESLKTLPHFNGIIDDLGGPSANMYKMDCTIRCKNNLKECIDCPIMVKRYPSLMEYPKLLKMASSIPGIKKVFVRSGIRLDLLNKLSEEDEHKYLYEICRYHVSGRLKVAPEHVNEKVLKMMNKGTKQDWFKFIKKFDRVKSELKREQKNIQLIPYFMAAHPGCGIDEMKELKAFIEQFGEIDQVQIFTPTPATLSSCMYWTGMHPFTGEKVYVPYSYNEKKMQKAMMFPSRNENKKRLSTLNQKNKYQ